MSDNNFYQRKVWTQADGTTVPLKDMTPTHRFNLLRWMNRHAEGLEFQDAIEALAFMTDNTPDDVVDGLARRDAKEWLASTPLYKRLRKLVKRDIKDQADPSRVERRAQKAEAKRKRREAMALHPSNGIAEDDGEDAWLRQDWREHDWDFAQNYSGPVQPPEYEDEFAHGVGGSWDRIGSPRGFAGRVWAATTSASGPFFASPGEGFHPSCFGIPGEMGMPEHDYG